MNSTMGFHSQLPSFTLADSWITVRNCWSGKKRSRIASPTASALVILPGTQVRRILQLGTGRRSLVATSRSESTTEAVPRMTVESSFTGMMTSPRPLVAT